MLFPVLYVLCFAFFAVALWLTAWHLMSTLIMAGAVLISFSALLVAVLAYKHYLRRTRLDTLYAAILVGLSLYLLWNR